MASTYSTNLALELIGTGEQSGTWGTTTNTNLGTLLEQAISGYVTQAITDGADTTITIPNGATGVARNMYIEMTGALTAARNLIVPANKKLYFIYNNTTGGYAVTVKVSGQTGVSVPNGVKVILVSNGTDIVAASTYLTSLTVGGSATANSFIPNSSTVPSNGMYLPAANTVALSTDGVERMRVDLSGNVGIGVTPATGFADYKSLQIGDVLLSGRTSTTATSELYLHANASIIDTYIGSDYAAALTSNDGAWTFKTAASGTAGNAISWTTAMALTSTGQLQIAANTNKLYLWGDATYSYVANNSGATAEYMLMKSSTHELYFGTSNVNAMTIASDQIIYTYAGLNPSSTGSSNLRIFNSSFGASSGTLYIGNQSITTSSDRRLKKNIQPTERDALALICGWEIVDHEWDDPSDTAVVNRNSRGRWMGVIAQQAIEYTPWLVNKPLSDVNEDDTPNYWNMDFGYGVPLLAKGMQQLVAFKDDHDTKINTLIAENTALKARVAALEAK